MTARERFESAQRVYQRAQGRREALETALLARYGKCRPPDAWMTRGEIARRDSIEAAENRAGDSMFAVLDETPRGYSWRSGVPWHWIMSTLSWADASTAGPLSVVPPAPFGYTARDAERFAEALEVVA